MASHWVSDLNWIPAGIRDAIAAAFAVALDNPPSHWKWSLDVRVLGAHVPPRLRFWLSHEVGLHGRLFFRPQVAKCDL